MPGSFFLPNFMHPQNQFCRNLSQSKNYQKSPKIMGILATPPKATPPRNKALLRVY